MLFSWRGESRGGKDGTAAGREECFPTSLESLSNSKCTLDVTPDVPLYSCQEWVAKGWGSNRSQGGVA